MRMFTTLFNSRRLALPAVCAFVFLVASLAAVAQPLTGAYTINPTGSGTTNFTSFGAAVTALTTNGVSGPVTFTVAAGTYNEQVLLPQITGASATNTITFDGGAGNAATRILTFTAVASGDYTFKIFGADYIRVKNLTITSATTATSAGSMYGFGMWIASTDTDSANFNIIENCRLNAPIGASVTASIPVLIGGGTTFSSAQFNNNNNQILNNIVRGGYYGIYARGKSGTPVYRASNTVISGNDVADYYYYGMYLYYHSHITVHLNNVYGMNSASSTTYGIYLYGGDGNTVVTRNTSVSKYYGLYLSSHASSTATLRGFVANNMVTCDNPSSSTYALYLTSCYNLDIYHNTINSYNNSGYCAYLPSGGNHNVRNNTFNLNGPSSSGYVFYTSIANTGFISLDYNNYYANTSGGAVTNFVYQSAAYATLAAWKTAQPTENMNSVNVDPMFPGRYNLRSMTSALQVGTPIPTVTIDIDNNPRSLTTPIIGCFEYSFPAKDIGAYALIAPIGKCGKGATETVTIQVRNYGTQAINCATDPVTVNVAITGAATLNLSGTVNSGTIPVNGTINVNMTTTANLTAAGFYTINATTTMASDGFAANNAMSPVEIQNSGTPVLATFPYTQDFETTSGGFMANPVSGTVNSWAWGVPAFTSATPAYSMNTASSGTKAWQTGYLNQVYPNSENSALESPCFNFSTLTNPVFAFMMNFGGENGYEASIVEGSTDGGQTWNKIDPLYPAYGSTSTSGPIPPPKWSNGAAPMQLTSYYASGWQKMFFQLGPTFAGKPVVMFRVRFGSDGSGQSSAGAAVDDIIIGDLLEKDLQVQTVFVRNATNQWSRSETRPHVVQVVVKNNGYEVNPTSVTVVYKEGSAPANSTDGVSETFTPTWSGSNTVLSFAASWTPATSGNKTIYARVFYTGDGQTSNDQGSVVVPVQLVKVLGYEDFNTMVPPTYNYPTPIPADPWVIVNNNGGSTWGTIAGLGYSGSIAAEYPGDVTTADDWFFTPGAALLAGTSYRVRLRYASQTGLPQNIQLFFGTAPNPGAMTPLTSGTLTNFTNTTFVQWGGTGVAPYFNTDPAGPATYYIGIKVSSPANNGRVLIDDVVLDFNPAPPPKIGYRYEYATVFTDDVTTAKIDINVVYKAPGTVVRRYQVTNTTGLYGSRGDFLWDAVGTAPWMSVKKDAAQATLQPLNPFTPPRPRQDQYFTLTVDPEGLNPGVYTSNLTLSGVLFNDDFPPTGPGLVATNQPFNIPVTLRVDATGSGKTGVSNGVAATTTGLTAPASVLLYDANSRLIAKLTATSGTIPAGFTVFEYPNQLPAGYTRLKYVRKYWKIEGTGTGWTADIEFYYTDTEANAGFVTARQNLRARRQPMAGSYFWTYAGTPASAAGSVSDLATNSVKILGINPTNISGNFALATNWDNTAKETTDATTPLAFELGQNFPNPFNPTTTINFSVPEDGMVNLVVFNSLGLEVARLVDQVLVAGVHSVNFDASNLPSGSYVYRLTSGGHSAVRQMMLAK